MAKTPEKYGGPDGHNPNGRPFLAVAVNGKIKNYFELPLKSRMRFWGFGIGSLLQLSDQFAEWLAGRMDGLAKRIALLRVEESKRLAQPIKAQVMGIEQSWLDMEALVVERMEKELHSRSAFWLHPERWEYEGTKHMRDPGAVPMWMHERADLPMEKGSAANDPDISLEPQMTGHGTAHLFGYKLEWLRARTTNPEYKFISRVHQSGEAQFVELLDQNLLMFRIYLPNAGKVAHLHRVHQYLAKRGHTLNSRAFDLLVGMTTYRRHRLEDHVTDPAPESRREKKGPYTVAYANWKLPCGCSHVEIFLDEDKGQTRCHNCGAVWWQLGRYWSSACALIKMPIEPLKWDRTGQIVPVNVPSELEDGMKAWNARQKEKSLEIATQLAPRSTRDMIARKGTQRELPCGCDVAGTAISKDLDVQTMEEKVTCQTCGSSWVPASRNLYEVAAGNEVNFSTYSGPALLDTGFEKKVEQQLRKMKNDKEYR